MVYSKKYFNLTKIFVLWLFKMTVNQNLRLGQRSVIKHLVAEKSKQWEINKRMCDVYGEAYFSPKMLTNVLNIGLPLQNWIEKSLWSEKKNTNSSKEKFQIQQSVKKDLLTFFWDMKGSITINFFENSTTVNRAFCYHLLRQNSMPLVKFFWRKKFFTINSIKTQFNFSKMTNLSSINNS